MCVCERIVWRVACLGPAIGGAHTGTRLQRGKQPISTVHTLAKRTLGPPLSSRRNKSPLHYQRDRQLRFPRSQLHAIRDSSSCGWSADHAIHGALNTPSIYRSRTTHRTQRGRHLKASAGGQLTQHASERHAPMEARAASARLRATCGERVFAQFPLEFGSLQRAGRVVDAAPPGRKGA